MMNLNRPYTVVREAEYKLDHQVFDGAPDAWAESHGATHTLWCGEGHGRGTRPAKLLKSVLYVGVDEAEEGGIVWEKWSIRQRMRFES